MSLEKVKRNPTQEDYEKLWKYAKKGLDNYIKDLIEDCNLEIDKRKDNSEYGETALYIAVCNNKVSTVRLLISYKADCNVYVRWRKFINYFWRPLHCAADKGHGEMVEVLLENYADFRLVDSSDKKPIKYGNHKIKEIITRFENTGTFSAKDFFSKKELECKIEDLKNQIKDLNEKLIKEEEEIHIPSYNYTFNKEKLEKELLSKIKTSEDYSNELSQNKKELEEHRKKVHVPILNCDLDKYELRERLTIEVEKLNKKDAKCHELEKKVEELEEKINGKKSCKNKAFSVASWICVFIGANMLNPLLNNFIDHIGKDAVKDIQVKNFKFFTSDSTALSVPVFNLFLLLIVMLYGYDFVFKAPRNKGNTQKFFKDSSEGGESKISFLKDSGFKIEDADDILISENINNMGIRSQRIN